MNRSSGFTMIELLVVIVIVGISLTLAIPNFREMTARNRVAYQVNDFLLAINLARSEAMRRGSAVSIQSASNGTNSADEFGSGYCVQIGSPGDTDYSTTCTYDATKCGPPQTTGCIIRQFDALTGNNVLNSDEDVAAITFGSLGELSAGAVRNVDLCPGIGEGRRIQIALVGRSKSHRVDDPDASKQPDC